VPYYEKDADTIAALESQLSAVGLPIIRVRKLNAILNAIEVQVEDEYADRQVVDSLFESLLLAAESIDSPAGVQFRQRVEDCRAHMAKRLSLRAVGGR
jgi:hypothetical protein